MLIHFTAELSHCNSLFRSNNYYMDLLYVNTVFNVIFFQEVNKIIMFAVLKMQITNIRYDDETKRKQKETSNKKKDFRWK